MKKSELLREAKKHLARNLAENDAGKGRFICFAIGDVDTAINPVTAPTRTALELRGDIRADIHDGAPGVSSYEGWLYNQGIRKDWDQPANFKKLQQSRLAWMEAMIAYYEAKGE